MTNPNIVILDAKTANPGDLSWKPFQQYGPVTVYEQTSQGDLFGRVKDAEVVFTNKVSFSKETLQQLPKLQFIGVTATGHNIIDVKAATQQGVVVCNVPVYSTPSVTQLVFAHLLQWSHHLASHLQDVKQGGWSQAGAFSYWKSPLREVSQQTMGIIGYGHIGQAVAKVADAFEMRVKVHTRTIPNENVSQREWSSLDELFQESDVITLHCPLTPETRNIVDAHRLTQMKPSSFLINTSRGGLVDEVALEHALKTGQIAGAALDVLSQEPPPNNHPLLHLPNCFITPHYAWGTQSSRQRLIDISLQNLEAFLKGQPINQVLPSV